MVNLVEVCTYAEIKASTSGGLANLDLPKPNSAGILRKPHSPAGKPASLKIEKKVTLFAVNHTSEV